LAVTSRYRLKTVYENRFDYIYTHTLTRVQRRGGLHAFPT